MANTSSRTLRLLSLLQARRYWPGPTLADRLEVSVRTLRRDIDRLRELGYPVEAARGVDGGYQLAAGAALPPLVIDDDEAVALAAAIQTQVDTPGAADAADDAAVRALTKIVQVMPARLRRRVEAVRGATTRASWGSVSAASPLDSDVLLTLAQGCRDSERVRFGHRRIDGTESSRHVEPYRLVALGRRWYLVAYDLDRGDWRTFRVDRISDARQTGSRFGARRLPFDDVADYVRTAVSTAGRSSELRAEMIIHAPAEQLRDRFGRWAEITEVDAGSCRLIMTSDSLDWPLFAAATAGAPVTFVSPPELARAAREWSDRLGSAAAAD